MLPVPINIQAAKLMIDRFVQAAIRTDIDGKTVNKLFDRRIFRQAGCQRKCRCTTRQHKTA